jgi:hypothetical protein
MITTPLPSLCRWLILVHLLFQVICSLLRSFFYQHHLSIYIPNVHSLEGCCAPRDEIIIDLINSHTPEHGRIIVANFIKQDRVSIGPNMEFGKIVQQFGDSIMSLKIFARQSVKWQISGERKEERKRWMRVRYSWGRER